MCSSTNGNIYTFHTIVCSKISKIVLNDCLGHFTYTHVFCLSSTSLNVINLTELHGQLYVSHYIQKQITIKYLMLSWFFQTVFIYLNQVNNKTVAHINDALT